MLAHAKFNRARCYDALVHLNHLVDEAAVRIADATTQDEVSDTIENVLDIQRTTTELIYDLHFLDRIIQKEVK